MSEKVTIAVLNYNGRNVIGDCLNSILNLKRKPEEIILVDDGSTDESVEWVRENHPAVRIVNMGMNTKRLNKVRNTALKEATFDTVLLVDNDVSLKDDCLGVLLEGLNSLPHAAVCMPRTLYDYDHGKIYQDGQVLHFVGSTYAINRNVPVQAATKVYPRVTIGWGVQLIRKKEAAQIGFFNEEYVMGWGDDGEFNHRMNLSGRLCYHIPTAVVYHKREEGAQRYYGSIRNRWRFILECYKGKTLFFCLPAFFIYEISVFLFLLKKGAGKSYFKALFDTLRDLNSIFKTRHKVQSQRVKDDKELMTSGSIFISPEYINSKFLMVGFKSMNIVLNGYWSLARRII